MAMNLNSMNHDVLHTCFLQVDVTHKQETHSFGGFKWFKEMPEPIS